MAQRPVPDIDSPPPKRSASEVETSPVRRDGPPYARPANDVPAESGEPEPEIVYVGRRSAYARRFGCGVAVIAWALIMLTPLALLILAVQGEITISHGDRVPEPEAHPLLQIRLLSEVRNAGLVITTSSLAEQSTQDEESHVCTLTHVRYLLWEGEGQNASYCDCYVRPSEATSNSAWSYTGTTQNTCEATP
jgi:hypothetical protein